MTHTTKFSPGQTVGILSGLQAVGGPVVCATGTVVRAVEFWTGVTEYVVDVNGEELVYRPSLLVDLPALCVGHLTPEHQAEWVDSGGLCESCQSRLTVEVAQESYRHAVRVLVEEGAPLPDVSDLMPARVAAAILANPTVTDERVRADAMRRHPAGKGRAL